MLVYSYLDASGVQAPTVRRRLLPFGRGSQMPMTIWWQVLDELNSIAPAPYLGFEIGQHVQLSHSGVLGYLIAQNETLGDSLSCFQRFQALLHNYGPVLIDQDQGQVHITWDYQGKTSTLLSDQVFVSSLITIVRAITGSPSIVANQICFQQDDPQALHPPMACSVSYKARDLSFSFPAQALQLPIRTTDPFLVGVMGRQAQALRSRRGDHFLQTVESRILAALSSGQPSAELIADELHMSRRNLHRKLKQHGVNFHHVLRQTRIKLAELYLQEADLHLAEVAFLLGYSEQSAFNRAFRLWHGVTPAVYKQALMNKPTRHKHMP